MHHLYAAAEALGVRIEYANLDHLGRDGDYNHATNVIRLHRGMPYRLERSVLAHELMHAIRGDRRTMFGWYDRRDERLADEGAAHMLIDMRDYQLAEEKYGTRTNWIAQELDVIEDLVIAFERTLCRIGDAVYVRPRHGLGQWDARYEAVAA